MDPGLFITFEGLDGSGKSTQLKRAVRYWRSRGYTIRVTREPGGTPVGEQIRQILLTSKDNGLAPLAELALMYAARAQLLQQVLRPALGRGEIVVSDRYNTASFAYQGFGRGLGTAPVRAFDWVICGSTQPDLTIILDLDPELARARASGRNTSRRFRPDRIEAQGLAFHRQVRAGYLALARRAPERIKIVSADQPIREIEIQIRLLLQPLFEQRSTGLAAGRRVSR